MSRPVELSTPMTPDSLRQMNQLLKHLYGQHTSKNKNASEVDGTEFVGTVENFGSEILAETSQLRQLFPSKNSLHVSDAMNFYFDLRPSGLISTLDQQNIVCAVLKNVDFMSPHQNIDLIFSDVTVEYGVRIDKVRNMMEPEKFYVTTTPPVLVISSNDSIEEYTLQAYDDTGVATKYMFLDCKATHDLLPDPVVDEHGNLVINIQTAMFDPPYDAYTKAETDALLRSLEDSFVGMTDSDVESYWDRSDMTVRAVNIATRATNSNTLDDEKPVVRDHDNRNVNTTYIWMMFDSFRTMYDVRGTSNLDGDGKPILTDGTNQNALHYLYPHVQGPDMTNLPQDILDDLEAHPSRGVLIRAFGNFPSLDNEKGIESQNFEVELTGVEICTYIIPHVTPLYFELGVRHTITLDSSIKLKLSKQDVRNVSTDKLQPIWFFGQGGSTVVGIMGSDDYMWDLELGPEIFAYSVYTQYAHNYGAERPLLTQMLYAFRSTMDDQHYIHPTEQTMNHTTVGMHIDSGTDYSTNAIPKKRGLIHDFSAFDGIPRYMSEWTPKDIKRGHMELYTVRDNVVKNDPMKRQTAAVIIDSGVPQNTSSSVIEDLNVVITYYYLGNFEHHGESVSSTNHLSDIGYDKNGIVGYTFDGYADSEKFIYHGNGSFSLDQVGFDPELETGRVIILSNDPATYVNAIVDGKYPRTFARICDLPTSYLQLTHVPGKSPTFVLNQEYVRQGASYTKTDWDNVWNNYHSPIIHGSKYVLAHNENFYTAEFVEENYSSMVQSANGMIDMTDPSNQNYYEFTIVNPGDCEDGDRFIIVIGGVTFNGTFNDDGMNQSVTIDSNISHIIPIANIPTRESIWKTTCLTDSSHNNLTVKLTINSEVWEQLNPHKGDVFDDLYALKFDQFGNIFAYHYSNGNWLNPIQVYGEKFYDNQYDTKYFYDWYNRKFDDVIVKNWNGCNHDSNYEDYKYIEKVVYENATPYDYGDMSEDIQNCVLNYAQSYYVLDTNNNLHVVTTVMPNRYLEIPRNHGYNSRVADQNLNTIKVGESVEFFDPFMASKKHYDAIANGIITFSGNETSITRESYFPAELLGLNMYDYSITNDVEESNARRKSYMEMTYDDLVTEITSKYGDVDLSEYDHDMLVDYLMERHVFDPVYKHSDLKLMDDSEQPTGGYVNIYDDVYDTRVTVNGVANTVTPSFVFRFSETIDQIKSAVGYNWREKVRMYDEAGTDISEYSILIIDNIVFTYSNGVWSEIQRQNS